MLLYDQNADLSKFLKTNYNKGLIFSLEEIKLNFRLSKFREALKAKYGSGFNLQAGKHSIP